MQTSGVSWNARRKQRRPGLAELSDTVQGQIEEICHDLAVQVKRMKQLQEQAQELRSTVRLRAAPSGADSELREPTNRGGQH
jgi:hypothetical protein